MQVCLDCKFYCKWHYADRIALAQEDNKSKLTTITDLKGNVLTVHDLPPQNTQRWTSNKKAIVVRAVQAKLITLEEALNRYDMTNQEFQLWVTGMRKHGATGLMLTRYQKQ